MHGLMITETIQNAHIAIHCVIYSWMYIYIMKESAIAITPAAQNTFFDIACMGQENGPGKKKRSRQQ